MRAAGIVLATIVLSVTPRDGMAVTPVPPGRSALDRYGSNIASILSPRGTGFPGIAGQRRSWDPEGLPPPLSARALFLRAWFSPSDSPVAEEMLSPALKAFPDLAPLLLWHLAHREGIPEKEKVRLDQREADSETPLFAPSSDQSRGEGRARALWRTYLAAPASEASRTDVLGLLVSAHPLSPESGLAMRVLGKAGLDGALLIPRWVILQKMGANDLVSRETRRYLALSPPFPYRDRALYLEARALVISGHSRKAMTLIESALRDDREPSAAPESSGNPGGAARKLAITSELDDLRCRMLLSAGPARGQSCLASLRKRYPRADFIYSQTVAELRVDLLRPASAMDGGWLLPRSAWDRPDGRSSAWLFGLDLAMRGKGAQAIGTWKALLSWFGSHPDASPEMTSRLLYFVGREYERTGHRSIARRYYARAMRRRSDTPYGLWAAIACRGDCGPFRISPHHPTGRASSRPALQKGLRELLQMGLFGPAMILEGIAAEGALDREQIARYGDMDLPVEPGLRRVLVARAFFRNGAGMLLPTGERLVPAVLDGFRRSGVPPLWAMAIARQESRFRARALSVDGALGVMQLMPKTALAVARDNVQSLDRAMVNNLGVVRLPGVNSLIGGLYLKRLIDAEPGHPERAIAGYNAGLHAVLSWKSLSRADWDFFTEAIPYQETRRYVREVLWNYAFLENRLKGRGF